MSPEILNRRQAHRALIRFCAERRFSQKSLRIELEEHGIVVSASTISRLFRGICRPSLELRLGLEEIFSIDFWVWERD